MLEQAYEILRQGYGAITARTPEREHGFLIRSEMRLGLRWLQVESLGGDIFRPWFYLSDPALFDWVAHVEIVSIEEGG